MIRGDTCPPVILKSLIVWCLKACHMLTTQPNIHKLSELIMVLYTGRFTLHAFSAFSFFWFWPKRVTSTKSKFAVRTDCEHDWRLASRKLSSLCCSCSDWMLKISSSVRHEDKICSSHGRWTWVEIVGRHVLLLLFWLDVENLEFHTK